MTENFAVYTIRNATEVQDVILNKGGQGSFVENKPWATADKKLRQYPVERKRIPLLLGNSISIIGVEWVAWIKDIRIHDRQTTVKYEGLRRLKQPIPLDALNLARTGEPMKVSQIKPYSLCDLQPKIMKFFMNALTREDDTRGDDALGVIDAMTVADYQEALISLEHSIPSIERKLLLVHAYSPEQTLSMEKIALGAGYKGYETANLHYGKLGNRLASFWHLDGIKTSALATGAEFHDDEGHFQWTLRRPLVQALQNLNWIDLLPEHESNAVRAARLELADDPKFRDADATTRSQLVEARIGQGDYRRRLLKLWGSQCAVTGVGISEALIASHIKPWADSSNAERLDKFNGLILSASIDRLFDQGLISFYDTGQIIANKAMDAGELLKLGISGAAKLRFVRNEHKPYLAYHRKRYRGA